MAGNQESSYNRAVDALNSAKRAGESSQQISRLKSAADKAFMDWRDSMVRAGQREPSRRH